MKSNPLDPASLTPAGTGSVCLDIEPESSIIMTMFAGGSVAVKGGNCESVLADQAGIAVIEHSRYTSALVQV
jgi:hypothetical protein